MAALPVQPLLLCMSFGPLGAKLSLESKKIYLADYFFVVAMLLGNLKPLGSLLSSQ